VALLKLLRAYSGGAAYGDPQDNSDYYRDKINGREDVQARGECLASGTTRCWRRRLHGLRLAQKEMKCKLERFGLTFPYRAAAAGSRIFKPEKQVR